MVQLTNRASQRVAEKLGAKQEGILRKRLMVGEIAKDALLYSLLPEDLIETVSNEYAVRLPIE